MKPLSSAAVLGLALIAARADADTARPQDYPVRPLRLIVPGPPGVPPDLAARIFSERLAPALGKPIVVENPPGATGSAGVRDSAPRGLPGLRGGNPFPVCPDPPPDPRVRPGAGFRPRGPPPARRSC